MPKTSRRQFAAFTALRDSITELEFLDNFTYPSNRNNIVTDQNTTSKFRLDTGLVQHLLKIWQARLVDIHRGVPRDLGREDMGVRGSCIQDLGTRPCGKWKQLYYTV